MNIAYLDLNYEDFSEDYALNPKAYGGGACFARFAKERLNGNGNSFTIFANPKSFSSLSEEDNKSACIPLSWDRRSAIRSYQKVSDIIPNAEKYDLFVHHFCGIALNLEGLRAKEICWSVGLRERCNEKTENLILYNDYQACEIPSGVKVWKAVIGKELPEFKEYQKEDYIFQCTRHDHIMGSAAVANFCRANGIKAIFAGPIANGYPLMEYIDNVNTFYLGIIDENLKKSILKSARLSTYIQSWDTPFNLSAIESLAYNVPIVAYNRGFWPTLIQEGVNGFFFDGNNFLEIWEKSKKINQRDCWLSANPYSVENMICQFTDVFQKVYESISMAP